MVPNFNLRYILGLVVLGLMLSSVPIVAQKALPDPGITPDSWTYGFKRFFEGVDMFFTFDDLAKAEKHVKYAELRLSEAKAMADKGKPEFVDDLVRDYEDNINKSNQIAEKAQQVGGDTTEVIKIVALATSTHLDVLDEVYEKVPEQAKEAILKAKTSSIKGHKSALMALSRKNPKQAADINLDTIKSRLKKAKQKAKLGQSENVEKILGEYREIVKISEELAERDNYTLEQLASDFNNQLRDLDEIEDMVPVDIKIKVKEKKVVSLDKQKEILRILAKIKLEKAVNISSEAAELRINRAKAKAEKNESEEVEKEIDEFNEFTNLGSEISQIAKGLGKNTTTVDQLVAKATYHHMEILNKIYEKVPEQAKPAIEKAINVSIKNRERVVKRLKEEDALSNIPEEVPITKEIKKKIMVEPTTTPIEPTAVKEINVSIEEAWIKKGK